MRAETCRLLERNPSSIEAWEERVDNLQALEAHEKALIVLDDAFEHIPPTSTTQGINNLSTVRIEDVNKASRSSSFGGYEAAAGARFVPWPS